MRNSPEQYNPASEEREKALANPIFKRIFGQLETFNRLHRGSSEEKDNIDSRFQQLFSECPSLVEYAKNSQGLNQEELVDLLLSRPDEAEALKRLLAGAEDERDGRIGIFTYELDEPIDGQNSRIVLHVPPYSGDNFKADLTESLTTLAEKLENRPEIKTVAGYSWLFENKWIEQLLPEGSVIEDESKEDETQESFTGSQRAALMFSKRALRRYLAKGELPKNKSVSMSSDEFIKCFLEQKDV